MSGFSDAEMIRMLTGVSRSFVLTIRALPKVLRRPIGIAYLLARASDTIADAATAPAEARLNALRGFVEEMAREGGPGGTREFDGGNDAERELMRELPRVISAFRALEDANRKEVVSLMRKITRGQELDLVRFPDVAAVRALETDEDLDEYTYLVAGCVGEFWTRICAAHLPRYSAMGLEELCALGRAFGQGLQLVNVLRDFPEDLRNGRCYLPMAELREAGVSEPGELRGNPRLAEKVFESWRRRGLAHLEDGRRYIEAVRPWRIRYACLLPWGLGVRTLDLISRHSPLEAGDRVKVTRGEVRVIMRRAVWPALSNAAVRRWAFRA